MIPVPRQLVFALALALAALPALASAQEPALVRGEVVDATGNPLQGAQASIQGTGLGALSNRSGEFLIRDIPPGTYTLEIQLIGYGALEERITLNPGQVLIRTFRMREEALQLQGITAVVGSRAAHTAAEELAVPVDVFTVDAIDATGTPEPAQILQELAPSVNFPRQTVADGTDAVRPFTLRGLSPDHTLVLVNGKRRHPTALVNVLGSGIQGGSSGVDLNAIPSNAIHRIEVLRDGAAAQYGSDAIAGVINLVLKDGVIPPTLGVEAGVYAPDEYDTDGEIVNITGEWGLPVAGGSFDVFVEYRDRNPTNRAGADPRDQIVEGDADVVNEEGDVVEKNNPVPQPNHHWGDGEQEDVLVWWNGSVPVGERGTSLYTFGGYSHRSALNQGFYRRAMDGRNWPSIYPIGFLPNFDTPIIDLSAAAGLRGSVAGWGYELGGQFARNDYEFNITNTLNTSLGPTIPPNHREFYAGALTLDQYLATLDVNKPFDVGFASDVNVALGVQLRYEDYTLDPGEPDSYLDGRIENQNGGEAASGSQVFPGFRPENAADSSRTNVAVYADLEADVAEGVLVNVAGRLEDYSDFGSTVTGKLALRYQPSLRWTFRAAASTGFRAPNLAQQLYAKTNTIFSTDPETGQTVPFEVGLFRVGSEVGRALGAEDLQEETALNFSGGFAVSPLDNLTVTADYFYIRIDDRIILSGQLSGEQVEALVSPFGAQRAQFFSNAIDTETQGVDVTTNYRTLVADGVLRLTGSFNYTQNRIVGEIRNPPELEGLEEQIFGFEARTAMEDEHPETVAKASVRYDRGPFGGTIRATRYGEVKDADSDPEQVQTLSEKTLVDLEAGYQLLRQVRITAGVRNLFDVFPDRTIDVNNFNGIFPYPRSSPFGFNGRYIYIGTRLIGLF